jgi:hypothetical protein
MYDSQDPPGCLGPLEVVHLTQHWRLIKGRWYRDAVVVVDGEQWVYALKDAA